MATLKWAGAAPLLVTALVASVVIVYAFVVFQSPQLRLRADQAGDNAYYLGLVFTLLSMAFALWSVGQQIALDDGSRFSVAEKVIGDFGLALGTTLVGIIARIVLHQMRIDPVGVEQATRLQLAQAASQMQGRLDDLSSKFGEFYETLRQKQEDNNALLQAGYEKIFGETAARTETTIAESVAMIQAVTTRVSYAMERFTSAANESTSALAAAAGRLADVEPPPSRLSQRFSTMANKVGDLTDQLSGTAESLSAAVEGMQRVAQATVGVHSSTERIRLHTDSRIAAMESSVAANVGGLAEAIDNVSRSVDQLRTSTQSIAAAAVESAEIVVNVEASAKEVLESLTETVRSLRAPASRDGQ